MTRIILLPEFITIFSIRHQCRHPPYLFVFFHLHSILVKHKAKKIKQVFDNQLLFMQQQRKTESERNAMKTNTEKVDRRTVFDVVYHDLNNYFFFFLPLMVIHNIGW